MMPLILIIVGIVLVANGNAAGWWVVAFGVLWTVKRNR